MKWVVLSLVFLVSTAMAGEVVVTMPGEVARAKAGQMQGKVEGHEARFMLNPGGRVNLDIVLEDGRRLLGVDMGWYRKAQKDQKGASEEDLAEIREILTVPSFYDRAEMILSAGDSQRVTGLIQLVRDRDFYDGKGEVIWRLELWYFEFANGGWMKVSQQNKVLERQRFNTVEAYRDYVSKLYPMAILGGVSLGENHEDVIIQVVEEQIESATIKAR